MISQISQINPYTLIPLLSSTGVQTKPKIYKSYREQERAETEQLLNVLSLSPDGIYVKVLQKLLEISDMILSDQGNCIRILCEKGSIEIVKDRYRIADKDLQKVLYRKLGSKKRANLHNYYGHALADTFRARKDKNPETAKHFCKAGNKHQSKEYLEKAGDYQKDMYKNNEAIKSYKKCISLMSNDEQSRRLDVMIKMLEIMYTTGKWDEFNAMYGEAELIAKGIGDKESRSKVLNLSGSVSFFRGEVDKAIKTFRKAEALMLDNTISYTYAETMRFLGRSFLQMGKNDKAELYFSKIIKIADLIQNYNLKALAFENMGRIYRLKSNYIKAIKFYKESLSFFKVMHDYNGITRLYEKLGVIHFFFREFGFFFKIISYIE